MREDGEERGRVKQDSAFLRQDNYMVERSKPSEQPLMGLLEGKDSLFM